MKLRNLRLVFKVQGGGILWSFFAREGRGKDTVRRVRDWSTTAIPPSDSADLDILNSVYCFK